MNGAVFNDLADYLRHGREIEFVYKDRQYSITNHSGVWYLCDDTDRILLEAVCRFEEKETLVSKIATTIIDALTIQQIFDRRVYDTERLSIILFNLNFAYKEVRISICYFFSGGMVTCRHSVFK